ncbi:MAG: hypothetical protein M3O76_00520 [Actinomycetota bacterium]|nr:hypothetical protein [Actinomycetota bacterium]
MIARDTCRAGRMAAQPKPKTAAERRGQMLCQLLEKDGAKLRSQARLHAQRPVDAEDALQEACVQFLRYYDGSAEEAILWMQVVVKRCAWAIGRRASRVREAGFELSCADGDERAMLPVGDRPDPTEIAERRDAVSQRARLLAELKPDERRALWLFGLGYSYKEIATHCGWTYTKVNRCVSEGRADLRVRLAERRA